ncbi:MAG: hypothetical protein A3I92_00210 [Candidatus Yanofskybacteria bacterium RIFCSPLOWO2_02_FULL_43_10b]|uniref:Uncharacterized protein n=1 Tax=Candidatus Yanofskybacteria bacterium RIFCSPLOWO2_02_FULL_43_10b TaxID=1802704 RepID=A0A1F8H237_9BACT|nr:MAG: hypothetical protein A3I92_00210 [Candidatus Yanofskybacteria bacterium RIFCSPLOWO2_02_FULL_43_10b]
MWNPFKKSKEYQFEEGELVKSMNFSLETQPEEVLPVSDWPEESVAPEEPVVSLEQLESEGLSVRLRRIIRGILLALVFLVPIFMIPVTAPGDVLVLNKQALIYGLVLISVILWLVMIVRQGGVRFKISGLELGMLIFLVAVLLSAIFSDRVYQSFLSSGGFVVLAALVILPFLLLNFFEKRESGLVVDYFMAGSFLAILFGLLSLYGLSVFKLFSFLFYKNLVFSSQFNTVGTVNNLGALASVLLVAISSSFFNSFTKSDNSKDENSRFWPWLMPVIKTGGAVSSVILLLILNWWVFYTVVAVGMAGTLFGTVLAKKYLGIYLRPKAVNLFGPLTILVLALLLLLGSRYFPFNFPGRQNLPLEVGLTQKGSFEVAKGSLSTKLPFGVGPGNFSLAFDKYKPSGVNNSAFWNTRFGNAASELWNLVIQTGVVGLGAFVFLIFSVLYFPLKKARSDVEGMHSWLEVMPLLAASLALFFLYPFNLVLNFVFWLSIGLWALTLSSDASQKRMTVKMDDISLRSVLSSLGFVLALVFGLVGGYLIFQKYQGELYFAKATRINLTSPAEIDKVIGLIGKSFQANQNDGRYLNGLAKLLLGKINLEINNKKDKPEETKARLENLVRSVVQVANQMTVNQPLDSSNWANAGFVYENLIGVTQGADQAAVLAYQEYLKRAPQDPSIYIRLGTIYLSRADTNSAALTNARRQKQEIQDESKIIEIIKGDYEKSEDSFKKAIELKRDLASALYNLGVVYERRAELKNAIKQLELTRLLEQNNPGLALELGLLYYRNGQKDNALAEMARAVSLSSNYANARWYLALFLEERGRVDLAIGQLKEILKIDVNKDNQVVLDKLAALEEGEREFPPGKVTNKKPLEEPVKNPR